MATSPASDFTEGGKAKALSDSRPDGSEVCFCLCKKFPSAIQLVAGFFCEARLDIFHCEKRNENKGLRKKGLLGRRGSDSISLERWRSQSIFPDRRRRLGSGGPASTPAKRPGRHLFVFVNEKGAITSATMVELGVGKRAFPRSRCNACDQRGA
jgi:hypothetical protein